MFHSALPKLWKHTAAVSMDSQRKGWLLHEPDQSEYVKKDHNGTEDIRLLMTQNQNAVQLQPTPYISFCTEVPQNSHKEYSSSTDIMS